MCHVYLGLLPQNDSDDEEAPQPVQFVMTGYSRLSHGLELGPSASQKNPLDRDLKNYEKNAKDYCLNIMKEQKRELKEGETVVKLVEPDPLLFWKIQVIISIFFTSNF